MTSLSSRFHMLISRTRLLLAAGLTIAVIGLVMLSAGLTRQVFYPRSVSAPAVSEPPYELTLPEREELNLPALTPEDDNFLTIMALIMAPFILIAFLYVLAHADTRREFLKDTLTRVAYSVILFFLLSMTIIAVSSTGENLRPPDLSIETGPGPQVAFTQNRPGWIGYAISLGLLLSLGFVGYTIWHRKPPEEESPLEMISIEARSALHGLRDGADLRNIILKCYMDMSRILDQQRGIRRPDWMTPREFEAGLIKLGLPADPVTRLTHLFERVRYGALEPGPDEQKQALDCLNGIATACSETM